MSIVKPSRDPDYVSTARNLYWFNEMVRECSKYGRICNMILHSDGRIFACGPQHLLDDIRHGETHYICYEIDAAFQKWVDKVTEEQLTSYE